MKQRWVVSIGGQVVKTDTSLIPRLGRLTEDSSPSGWVGGVLGSLLGGSLKGCGRGLEWSHSVPHKGPAKFNFLFLILLCYQAVLDVLEPGSMVYTLTAGHP